MNTTNGTVGEEVKNSDRDEHLARIEVAILSVIFLLTVLGNSTVLIALYTRKKFSGRKKLSRMYFFILHLSIADLVTAFLGVLPQLGWDVTYRFYGGFLMCKVIKYGQTLGPYLSSYILIATAIDRHQAICYPLTYCSWTSRRSKIMVFIAWIISLIFCIPQILIFSIREALPGVPGSADCWAKFSESWGEKAYVTWYSISVFIVPLIVLIVTYSSICREIWRSARLGYLSARPTRRNDKSQHTPLISRAKINTVKQTVAVIVMHILCSTPFISAQLWATWDPHARQNPFLDGPTFTILVLLYSLNSCVNPWIYLAFNKELPRLLLRQYRNSAKTRMSYKSATSGNDKNKGDGESTSLKPFTRVSFCNKTNGYSSKERPYLAQFYHRKWMVTTQT